MLMARALCHAQPESPVDRAHAHPGEAGDAHRGAGGRLRDSAHLRRGRCALVARRGFRPGVLRRDAWRPERFRLCASGARPAPDLAAADADRDSGRGLLARRAGRGRDAGLPAQRHRGARALPGGGRAAYPRGPARGSRAARGGQCHHRALRVALALGRRVVRGQPAHGRGGARRLRRRAVRRGGHRHRARRRQQRRGVSCATCAARTGRRGRASPSWR